MVNIPALVLFNELVLSFRNSIFWFGINWINGDMDVAVNLEVRSPKGPSISYVGGNTQAIKANDKKEEI